MLEGIYSLLNKSLLVRIEANETVGSAGGYISEGPRFTMLETIREYARERLATEVGDPTGTGRQGESDTLERAHALYFMQLAEEAEPHLSGPDQVAWLDHLEVEHDNLRAALRWAKSHAVGGPGIVGDAQNGPHGAPEASEILLRMVAALSRYWTSRCYPSEAREWLVEALSHAGYVNAGAPTSLATGQPAARGGQSLPKEWRAHVGNIMQTTGHVAYLQDDYPSARAFFEQALAMHRQLGDQRGISRSLVSLGTVANTQADYAAASPLFEEALAISRAIGDRLGELGALRSTGEMALIREDNNSAQQIIEQCLTAAREIGNRAAVVWCLHRLGTIAELREDYVTARSTFDQGLAAARELGYKGFIAETLSSLGSVARSDGDYRRARTLYEQSLTMRREIGDRYGMAACFIGLGELALTGIASGKGFQQRDRDLEEQGVRLLAAAEALLETIGAQAMFVLRRVFERGVAAAHSVFDDKALAKVWAEGKRMPLEEATALAMALALD